MLQGDLARLALPRLKPVVVCLIRAPEHLDHSGPKVAVSPPLPRALSWDSSHSDLGLPLMP